MNDSANIYLLSAQNPDGGWGYAPGQTSSVEPTAAALLALRAEEAAGQTYASALAWLRTAQRSDGGWGLTAGDEESGWQTAWAALALARTGVPTDGLQPALDWLARVEVLTYPDGMQRIASEQILAIDANLYGWPWWPGEASWVEPTALTLLAFQAAQGYSISDARADQATRYLLDRRCIGGGWNVGNPVMFDSPLPARAVPTAWTILALAGAAPDQVTAEDLAALDADARQDGGALALAWGVLALRAMGRTSDSLLRRLAALQSADGSWNADPYRTAVAWLALQGQL